MAITRKPAKKDQKHEVKAFVNWSVMTSNGLLSSSRGFPIFENEDYPNPEEALLVAATEAKGGMLEMTLKVRVCLNRASESKAISVEDLLGEPAKAKVTRTRKPKTAKV
jgi:hypothetical protein